VRLFTALVLAALLAGCGSSSHERSMIVHVKGQTVTYPFRPGLPPACAHRGGAAVDAAHAEPFKAPNGADGCRLTAQGLTAIVMLDSAPQPYFRLEREVTEFGQNVDWTKVPASAYPRTIKHLGLDANWFPLQHRLLTTDGVRLVTVKLRSASMDPAELRDTAVRLAGVYLGPLVKPAGY
jgi:hypothetical protein